MSTNKVKFVEKFKPHEFRVTVEDIYDLDTKEIVELVPAYSKLLEGDTILFNVKNDLVTVKKYDKIIHTLSISENPELLHIRAVMRIAKRTYDPNVTSDMNEA